MSIARGIYSIRSAAFNQVYAGRSRIEDLSLNPKGVFGITSEFTTPTGLPDNLIWDITAQPQDAGFSVMKIEGAPTAVINDRLFAILLDSPPEEHWHLEEVPQHKGQYLIHTRNGTLGWALPDEEPFTPISVRPLIEHPSEPPQYPANQRWVLDRLD